MFLYPGGKELFKMLRVNLVVPIEAIGKTFTAINVTGGGFNFRLFQKAASYISRRFCPSEWILGSLYPMCS